MKNNKKTLNVSVTKRRVIVVKENNAVEAIYS
jgi:hypothetical protein